MPMCPEGASAGVERPTLPRGVGARSPHIIHLAYRLRAIQPYLLAARILRVAVVRGRAEGLGDQMKVSGRETGGMAGAV